MNIKLKDFLKLVTAITITEFAGIIGSIFTISQIPTWYNALNKPALNPPSWIFGPVWTTLYLLMGIALFLVWKKGLDNKLVKKAIFVYGLQLVLNTTWSIVFFGLHNSGLAFVNIIIMWLAIFWTMILFYKISKPSMLLLVPYIVWVSFAGYLNYSIWILN